MSAISASAAAPRNLQWSEITDDDELDLCDTLMIKNIPSRCSQDEVLQLIDHAGFGDCYHFFYLPRRTAQGQNHGYAFVGLRDPSMAPAFIERISGLTVKSRNSNKALSVAAARIQGIDNNLKHFRDTRFVKSKWKPFFAQDTLLAEETAAAGAINSAEIFAAPGQMLHEGEQLQEQGAGSCRRAAGVGDAFCLAQEKLESSSTVAPSESEGYAESHHETESVSDMCASGRSSLLSSPSCLAAVRLQVTADDHEEQQDEGLWQVTVDKTFINVKPGSRCS
eukprot:TRINITY_DN43689_c0_g1_i4.p1 TRINITY_DN43689_c0_g1~~TRINITY_DN43689_c0_g1_i4.p1  ORF type:complete len:280 (-),score=63.19 TRINITY_DN43689_c0_g1_i4:555-1394(-)